MGVGWFDVLGGVSFWLWASGLVVFGCLVWCLCCYLGVCDCCG